MEEVIEKKTVELPSKEEIQEWMAQTYGHVNPDVRDFFFLGIEALYTKLGGDKLLVVK